jgi:hypothetical protein
MSFLLKGRFAPAPYRQVACHGVDTVSVFVSALILLGKVDPAMLTGMFFCPVNFAHQAVFAGFVSSWQA